MSLRKKKVARYEIITQSFDKFAMREKVKIAFLFEGLFKVVFSNLCVISEKLGLKKLKWQLLSLLNFTSMIEIDFTKKYYTKFSLFDQSTSTEISDFSDFKIVVEKLALF